jgi:hypothetical protein
MKFTGNKNSLNFKPELQPLFDAMSRGKIIKSVTCMRGTSNKDDRTQDFTIENFIATDYEQDSQQNFDGSEHYDYVYCDSNSDAQGFYMNWVLSFVL